MLSFVQAFHVGSTLGCVRQLREQATVLYLDARDIYLPSDLVRTSLLIDLCEWPPWLE